MKRSAGEGAVSGGHHFGSTTEHTISVITGVTENDTTRWHRFVRSDHVNHRGPTPVFSATDSFVFHVKHGHRSGVRFLDCADVRKHWTQRDEKTELGRSVIRVSTSHRGGVMRCLSARPPPSTDDAPYPMDGQHM